MEYRDLKKGCYIKWVADRYCKSWDTFGKVIKKVNGTVTILTFDDFKETELVKNGNAIAEEIRLATKSEVDEYITAQAQKLIADKILLKIKLKTIDKQIKQLEGFVIE